jgi:hypothetical protein
LSYEPPILQDRAGPADPADQLAAGSLPMAADERGWPGDDEIVADEDGDEMLGESPPEHGWLGKGFVGALYTLAPVQLIFALYTLYVLASGLSLDALGISSVVGMLPMVLFLPLLFLWVARSVQTFKLTGWGVAMAMLLFAAFSTLRLLLGDPDGIQILAALATGALEIAWISYFWSRKPDFT